MRKKPIKTKRESVFEDQLMFPKQANKKKRKSHAKESIMQTGKYCYLCFVKHGEYNYRALHKHHALHGFANRELAEADGLYIYCCLGCHELDPDAVHNCYDTDLYVMQQAQNAYEAKIGNRESFIRRYGKSFL